MPTTGSPVTYTSTVQAEWGFELDGTPRSTDYSNVQLNGTPPTLSQIVNSTTGITITGSVYIPVWVDGTYPPHFQFLCPGGHCDISNNPVGSAWTSAPQAGQTATFTITTPKVTSVADNPDGTYNITAIINGQTLTGTVSGGKFASDMIGMSVGSFTNDRVEFK